MRVLIFTGSEGVVEGSLSGVISFTINSNAQKFQLLLTVQRLAGNFCKYKLINTDILNANGRS